MGSARATTRRRLQTTTSSQQTTLNRRLSSSKAYFRNISGDGRVGTKLAMKPAKPKVRPIDSTARSARGISDVGGQLGEQRTCD